MYILSALLAFTCSKCPSIFNCQRSGNPDVGFQISDFKGACYALEIRHPKSEIFLVGLGRIELPTSPLSGVRSSQLSYRPDGLRSWWSWSGSNRRPPECKSGALPAELQPLKF